jgi:hypothetical protein
MGRITAHGVSRIPEKRRVMTLGTMVTEGQHHMHQDAETARPAP